MFNSIARIGNRKDRFTTVSNPIVNWQVAWDLLRSISKYMCQRFIVRCGDRSP
jgi:hypothetical protein